MNLADFIEWEKQQETRHEFVDGEAYAMVGARRVHNEVTGNLGATLKQHLRGGPCRTYMLDLKLKVAENIYYPDILVSCNPEDNSSDLFVAHPKVIVEILSESTASYDRGAKFAAYRGIAELEEYALIDPDTKTIEVFRRTPNGDWLLALSDTPRGLVLHSLDFVAPAAAVFENV